VVSGPPLDPGAGPEVGRPVALSSRVVRVTAPNPGIMTGVGTNSYVVGTTDRVVIDPGPAVEGDAMAGHLDALVAAAGGRIRWIVVTHTHLDHSPAAAALHERTGAEVIGYDARDGFAPDRSVSEGFTVAGPGFRLRALHTPGHATNHLCWLLTEERMLFSGDHVMGGSTVVIAPPDGDMVVYLDSLRRLLELDPALATIAPGHGALLTDPAATVTGVMAHRLEREAMVVRALAGAGPVTVEGLLPLVYGDVGPDLRPVAAKSLWAHLRKLAGEGRARSTDVDDNASTWVATG
jgi:glyoxylase-like metal-dependent hydrolase (beta-lactamase superfamily II)